MDDKTETNREISIPMQEVYRLALIMLPLIFMLYLIPYLIIWFRPFIKGIPDFFSSVFSKGGFHIIIPYIIKGFIAFFTGIILHELLHALGWLPFTKHRFRSLRFGIKKPEMAPYAHCTESLPVNGYRTGILLPSIVLGLSPALYGIIKGSFPWLCYGIFFTWAASGDLIMFWRIKELKSTTMVMDHPEKLGCFITGNRENRK